MVLIKTDFIIIFLKICLSLTYKEFIFREEIGQ